MQDTVFENQELIILSQEITNATKCKVIKVLDDESFQVELKTKENYTKNEEVEIFAVVGSGVLYMVSDLKQIDNLLLTINKPIKSTLIQRREYARVEIHKNILIPYENKNIRAEILDISAGGMKISSETEMSRDIDYNVAINLGELVNFSCKFNPIRIVYDENAKKYSISGKFKLIRNIDKVALVQFCMKKQSELQIK